MIGCEAANLVFVSNATAGVNSVLRSLRFRRGDQIVVTDHGYNACRNVAVHVAERDGAEVVVAPLPLVVDDPRQIVDAILVRSVAACCSTASTICRGSSTTPARAARPHNFGPVADSATCTATLRQAL